MDSENVSHADDRPKVVRECSECGRSMVLTAEMNEQLPDGAKVKHEVCPDQRPEERDYRVEIVVYEGGEPIAKAGATRYGPSFSEVAGDLTAAVTGRWEQVMRSAKIADRPEGED